MHAVDGGLDQEAQWLQNGVHDVPEQEDRDKRRQRGQGRGQWWQRRTLCLEAPYQYRQNDGCRGWEQSAQPHQHGQKPAVGPLGPAESAQ